MLGFFAIYTGSWSDRFVRNRGDTVRRGRRFGLLPHEIAALNDA
jgi:hypothetical protein